MSVDRVSDFLTTLRNAINVSARNVVAPHSRVCLDIVKILKDEGFVRDYRVDDNDPKKVKLSVALKYVNGESVIHDLKRVSTPGRRRYSGVKNLEPVIGGLGIAILSTNAGIITDKKAKQLSVGGEILCHVW